ncbi:protealysin inhibitor emfourin [Micromonospora sp. IBHARD004]|uniref:protealysin inhibitor emfourin n=1 Tax=Micromonospora sp. IBHARD004 TaxID=3457764 RepID=UPI0040590268
MRSNPRAAATLAALLVALAGCATTDPTVATPGAPASGTASATLAARVVLTKSGGIAGLRDTVTVEPDGRWTVADKTGATRSGQLSSADLDRLRQLTADSRLAGETAATTAPSNCADAFTYQLTVGERTTGYVDCPTDPARPAATAAVAELLTRATT